MHGAFAFNGTPCITTVENSQQIEKKKKEKKKKRKRKEKKKKKKKKVIAADPYELNRAHGLVARSTGRVR
jgi:hypothetical protein